MEGLNRLQVYQEAQGLVSLVYKNVVSILPTEEKYGLASQIRRAAISIPANIAEGYGRYYYQESIRFCYLARGSLAELSSHITIAHNQNYLPEETKNQITEKMHILMKLLHGYINYLKKSKQGWNEAGSLTISDLRTQYSEGDTHNDKLKE